MQGKISSPKTGLEVELRPSPDGSTYRIGVVVDGAFVAVSESSSGFVDDLIRQAEGQRLVVDADTHEGTWLSSDDPRAAGAPVSPQAGQQPGPEPEAPPAETPATPATPPAETPAPPAETPAETPPAPTAPEQPPAT